MVTANSITLKSASEYLVIHDPILGSIIENAPLPHITPHENYYQKLVESIISQQLSVKAASTILKRFVALFDDSTFPSPNVILLKSIDELRAAGLSRQKAGYIQDLAMKVIDGSVHFTHLDALTNDEIIDELVNIKGVGVWTVHMFLIFCMGRLDILPVGDLGIKNGIQRLYNLAYAPTPDEITTLSIQNMWHPYETVASWYIWHSLDNKPTV